MNWDKRLTRAYRQGLFLTEESKLSNDWSKCAVGEHAGEYRDRWHKGMPRAEGLRILGQDFGWAVRNNRVATARAIYDRIQAWFKRYGKAA